MSQEFVVVVVNKPISNDFTAGCGQFESDHSALHNQLTGADDILNLPHPASRQQQSLNRVARAERLTAGWQGQLLWFGCGIPTLTGSCA